MSVQPEVVLYSRVYETVGEELGAVASGLHLDRFEVDSENERPRRIPLSREDSDPILHSPDTLTAIPRRDKHGKGYGIRSLTDTVHGDLFSVDVTAAQGRGVGPEYAALQKAIARRTPPGKQVVNVVI